MIYFLTGLLLAVYFELLGQSFLSLAGKERKGFSFGTGFILMLAVAYLSTSLLTAMNCSFYLILVIYTILFLLSGVLILRQRKSLAISFSWPELALLLAVIAVLMYYSLNTGFGDLDGFDSTFYLNMVTNNIGLSKLNSRSVYYGDNAFSIQLQYTFQSYYYLASVLIFYVEKFCSLLHISFYRTPCFVWPNQILFFALLASLISKAIRRSREKNYALIALGLILTVFYFGRFYFNSVFGFYGNSLRTLLFGYACCHMLDYQISKDRKDKLLFYLTIPAICACSSSGVFACFFLFFALYFLWIGREKDLLKEYAAVLLFPAVNLIAVLRNSVLLGFAAGVVFAGVLWVINELMKKIGKDKRNRLVMLAVCALTMLVMSYMTDGKIFHYEAFALNNSQQYDMTINYFYYPGEAVPGIKAYKFTILAILAVSILFVRNDMTNVDLVLIAVFFNPFCCAFLNKINPVFYRSYDIIINPFTIVFFINCCGNLISIKYAKELIAILLSLYLLYLGGITKPIYYHKSFAVKDDYNQVYRMRQDEFDALAALSAEISYHQDIVPKIITPNKLTQSMLRTGEFLYGRENKRNENWTEAENELFNIFYPVEFYGDPKQPAADYDHMCEYLQEADIRYIVQDKEVVYYDSEKDVWYSLTYLIDRCGTYPFYDSDRYSVYRFDWEK